MPLCIEHVHPYILGILPKYDFICLHTNKTIVYIHLHVPPSLLPSLPPSLLPPSLLPSLRGIEVKALEQKLQVQCIKMTETMKDQVKFIVHDNMTLVASHTQVRIYVNST